jgi:small subunit ribosomal protein S17
MPTSKANPSSTKPSAKAPAKAPAHAPSKLAAEPSGPVVGSKTGFVESDKRSQTRRVVVAYSSKHPKYGKYIRQRTILQVHDPRNESHTGDLVEVAPCRPVSRTKTWRLVRVVENRSAQAAALASAKAIAE